MKKKRKRGRPPKKKSEKKRHMINLKVDDAELKALDDRAEELGISRSDLLREAIRRVMR